MDPVKRQHLRRSLEERLTSTSIAQRYSHIQRLAWLAEHIEEYVDRWLGLWDLEGWSWPEIVEHDLFQVIVTACDLFTGEMAREDAAPDVSKQWLMLLSLLGEVRVIDKRQRADQLLAAARDLRVQLQAMESC